MTMGDRIVVMRDGVIQQVDTPQNIYNHPSNIFVAGFMGSPQMNFFDGKLIVEEDKAYASLGNHKILLPEEAFKTLKDSKVANKEVTFGIRPEYLDDGEELIANNPQEVVKGEVEVIELMGSESYIYVKVDGVQLTVRVNGTTKLKVGDKADIHVDSKRIHVFDKETELRVL